MAIPAGEGGVAAAQWACVAPGILGPLAHKLVQVMDKSSKSTVVLDLRARIKHKTRYVHLLRIDRIFICAISASNDLYVQ